MSHLFPETEQALSEIYGEVGAHFTITETPAGGAPEAIKEQWVGLTMPVRVANLGRGALEARIAFDVLTMQMIENNSPVSVTGIDAIHALEDADKQDAADFWSPYGLALFTSRGHEGILVPVAQQ